MYKTRGKKKRETHTSNLNAHHGQEHSSSSNVEHKILRSSISDGLLQRSRELVPIPGIPVPIRLPTPWPGSLHVLHARSRAPTRREPPLPGALRIHIHIHSGRAWAHAHTGGGGGPCACAYTRARACPQRVRLPAWVRVRRNRAARHRPRDRDRPRLRPCLYFCERCLCLRLRLRLQLRTRSWHPHTTSIGIARYTRNGAQFSPRCGMSRARTPTRRGVGSGSGGRFGCAERRRAGLPGGDHDRRLGEARA